MKEKSSLTLCNKLNRNAPILHQFQLFQDLSKKYLLFCTLDFPKQFLICRSVLQSKYFKSLIQVLKNYILRYIFFFCAFIGLQDQRQLKQSFDKVASKQCHLSLLKCTVAPSFLRESAVDCPFYRIHQCNSSHCGHKEAHQPLAQNHHLTLSTKKPLERK